MLRRKWTSVTITTNQQANDMIALFKELKPEKGATDTETTGLHIILDKPFVAQFGFLHPTEMLGYTFAVDLERQPVLAMQVLKYWWFLAETLKKHVGANIKYDLHMLTNIGIEPYPHENYTDVQFYIRYGHDALKPENGGPPLDLKDYTSRYVDHTAKNHERKLSQERTAIAAELNMKLKQKLAPFGKPPEKYKAKSYTLGVIDKMFKDPVFDYTDLPENIQEAYLEWKNELPLWIQNKVQSIVEADMIPYNVLNRQNLIKYGHYDIIYTLEDMEQLEPVVEYRQNYVGVEIENNLILPLYEMERVGFKTDKDYLEASRIKLKDYIKSRRSELYQLINQEVSIGQHALIKSILQDQFNVPIDSTNKEVLDLKKADLMQAGNNPEAVQFIDLIQELRTLEKWYSAYIIRFQKNLRYTDTLYTTIHQVGTVSGRVTSDFQQFPKKAIHTFDDEDNELFNPRRMVLVPGGDYDALVYLDYSQIELRFQAIYTILVGHPDLNLCRAYMPFQCHNNDFGSFNYADPNHIKHWEETWYLDEQPESLWTPTDVHAETTKAATGKTKDDPEFYLLRTTIGKKVNFSKNYGAERNRMRAMFPWMTEDEITRVNNAYHIAFPGVRYYHDYCNDRAALFAGTPNLFGISYYGVSGHKLKNLLIQGSAAFYLKIKIRELYDYTKANAVKSRWQMNIHDELSWARHREDLEVFFKFKEIMEDWPDALVPIVAEMDATITTWADKKGVDSLDALRTHLSH